MPDPKPFQLATVEAALLARRRSKARFLVADEVGLGKTVVAQQLMLRLMEEKRGPLVVFYVCSSLSIASQNRKKLLEVLPDDERHLAHCKVDRLTLIPANDPPSHPKLRVYTLTPETSIPVRKNRRRDGRQEERALIQCLVERHWPDLLKGRRRSLFQRKARSYWRWVVRNQRQQIKGNAKLVRAFYESVRKEFGVERGQHILPVLLSVHSDLDLIAHMRNALAACAIEGLDPDLIVFDEFQNFRDLLKPDKNNAAHRVIQRLQGEGSGTGSMLLLLSATPYSLYTRNRDANGGASHHAQFFELVEFLYGGDANAKSTRRRCQNLFAELQTAIRRADLDVESAHVLRSRIQRLLRPIMSRTERASHEDGWLEHSTSHSPAPLRPEDIRVYRHLAEAMSRWHAGAAVPYWTSIPLPAQTMGNRYVAWKECEKQTAREELPQLTEKMRNQFASVGCIPHPKLRSLLDIAGFDSLLLPWLEPSITWWSQGGKWVHANDFPGKVLIFSRFRAVPQAVASLVSYALESELFAGHTKGYSGLTDKRMLHPGPSRHALLGYFHPSPWLIENADPLLACERTPSRIRRAIRGQLRSALSGLDINVNGRLRRNRPAWALLAQIERAAGYWDFILSHWEEIHRQVGRGGEEQGLGKLLKDWDTQSEEPLDSVSESELNTLVEYAFHSPGIAVGRALYRHWPVAIKDEGFETTLLASWQGLRNYLDNPLFAIALGREDDNYPTAIMDAVRDGNLEAVLDEQLWLMRTLYGYNGKSLAMQLADSLQLRSGVFRLHELKGNWGRTFSLRCHVAMPFTEVRAVTVKGMEKSDKPLRTDEIRRAFNAPFWPYILTTTSVGQEGLDFHAWCSSLVHWDLSHNPVDLEQREGRIQRFAGHSIRREIAKRIGEDMWRQRKDNESPWVVLARLAEHKLADDSGLCPWWVCKGADVRRLVFDVPSSEQHHWLQLMKEQRLLYRIVLGQPDQEDLVHHIAANRDRIGDLRDVTLELSAYFSRRDGSTPTRPPPK